MSIILNGKIKRVKAKLNVNNVSVFSSVFYRLHVDPFMFGAHRHFIHTETNAIFMFMFIVLITVNVLTDTIMLVGKPALSIQCICLLTIYEYVTNSNKNSQYDCFGILRG